MANIVSEGNKLGKRLQDITIEAGQRYAMNNLITPKFRISKTQHQRIMEILGVKNYKTKKLINNYIVTVKENGSLR